MSKYNLSIKGECSLSLHGGVMTKIRQIDRKREMTISSFFIGFVKLLLLGPSSPIRLR